MDGAPAYSRCCANTFDLVGRLEEYGPTAARVDAFQSVGSLPDALQPTHGVKQLRNPFDCHRRVGRPSSGSAAARARLASRRTRGRYVERELRKTDLDDDQVMANAGLGGSVLRGSNLRGLAIKATKSASGNDDNHMTPFRDVFVGSAVNRGLARIELPANEGAIGATTTLAEELFFSVELDASIQGAPLHNRPHWTPRVPGHPVNSRKCG